MKSSITISIPLERGDATEEEGVETATYEAVPITNSPSLSLPLSRMHSSNARCIRPSTSIFHGEEKEKEEEKLKYRTQQEEMLPSKISRQLLNMKLVTGFADLSSDLVDMSIFWLWWRLTLT